jgi:drug/metabolite transporter (DMT)-like permease
MADRHNTKSTGPLMALVTVQLLFATWPIVGKIALQTVPPIALVGFRVAIATVILVILAGAKGRLKRIAKPDWPLLIVSSLLGLIFNQWLFVKGLSITTAINATLISTTIPISTLVVGIVFGAERSSWRRFVGIAIAAAGVMYLIGFGRASFSASTRIGDLLVVANSLCYGAYIAVSKDLVRRYSPLTVITWVFIIGSVAAIPAGAISMSNVPLRTVPANVWIEILYIGVLPTAAAYFLNAWALARVPPSTVAVFIYLQPLFAFVLAPLVLGESLSLRVIISSIAIFVGVLIVTRRRAPKIIPAPEVLENA